MDDTPHIYFREDQPFRSPYLWTIAILFTSFISGTTLWMIVRQVIQDQAFGDEPMSNAVMITLGGFIIALNGAMVIFLLFARLQVEVSTAGLFVRFYPRQTKIRKIDLDDHPTVAVIEYSALRDYGGWTVKRGRRYTAYTVGGDQGVAITYENGHHVLIGSQHPELLAAAINELMFGAEFVEE